MLSKSYLPPAAAAFSAALAPLRLAARGARARTPPPKPALLRNDLRFCPVFTFCSKGNLPIIAATPRLWRECDAAYAASLRWPMNTDYNVISMCAEAIEAVFPKETWADFAIWIKVEKLDFLFCFAAAHTEIVSKIFSG